MVLSFAIMALCKNNSLKRQYYFVISHYFYEELYQQASTSCTRPSFTWLASKHIECGLLNVSGVNRFGGRNVIFEESLKAMFDTLAHYHSVFIFYRYELCF